MSWLLIFAAFFVGALAGAAALAFGIWVWLFAYKFTGS